MVGFNLAYWFNSIERLKRLFRNDCHNKNVWRMLSSGFTQGMATFWIPTDIHEQQRKNFEFAQKTCVKERTFEDATHRTTTRQLRKRIITSCEFEIYKNVCRINLELQINSKSFSTFLAGKIYIKRDSWRERPNISPNMVWTVLIRRTFFRFHLICFRRTHRLSTSKFGGNLLFWI